MGCSPFDLKDYFFGELSRTDRQAVDNHLAACIGCREQLDALQLTQSALLSVRDEEPPRRIAFVSDKVFEPRWWESVWQSKLGFASAAMLALAILAHGYLAAPRTVVQQAQSPVAAAPPAAVRIDNAAVQAEIARQLQPVVERIVSASEQRQAARIAQVSAEQKRSREDLASLGETVGYMRRTFGNFARASMDSGGAAQ